MSRRSLTHAVEHEYLFDAKLFASFRVKARSAQAARQLLARRLDCATVHCGVLPAGSILVGHASLDGDLDLIEVDGEEVL